MEVGVKVVAERQADRVGFALAQRPLSTKMHATLTYCLNQ